MADLEYTVSDGIGTILLNRPDTKNAFTLEMVDEWASALAAARTDDDVKVIVLTGAGSAFCSGIDLGKFGEQAPEPLARKKMLTDRVHRVAMALEDMDKPVIAAVHGPAVGAGMDMALMCDMRYASESAKFSEGYIKVGLVPGDGGAYFLPRLVGMGKALELLWTGDLVGGAEAKRIGLVNDTYPDSELSERVYALARRIAVMPPENVRMIKRAAYQCARADLRTALDLISSHMAVVQTTHDSQEAFSAFREKREPRFLGR